MLNTRKQAILEEYVSQRTDGTESLEEVQQLIREMGIKFNNQENDYE